ncbi:unannotated protein [freshwater metagenome]|uniref:Unannotated protein n=1 Tax=freshwater metagenome TaxID=449393 RepID=A0A6J6ARL8_9ZZZZ
MYLCDRCGSEWRFIERLENLFKRCAEIFFNGGANYFKRLSRYLVTTLFEFGNEFLGEEAFARRNDLSEFDVGRSETFDGESKATGEVGTARYVIAGLAFASSCDPPQADCGAEIGDNRDGAFHIGQPARRCQFGKVMLGLPADGIDDFAPRHRYWIDDPWRFVRERTECEIGGTNRSIGR